MSINAHPKINKHPGEREGGVLVRIDCPDGVVPNMYGCTSGGPELEPQVGPCLDIEPFYHENPNNCSKLRSQRISTPYLGEHLKPSVLCLISHRSYLIIVPSEFNSNRDSESARCVYANT
ncbi:unnamed protein product, partial [Brenthis ino]